MSLYSRFCCWVSPCLCLQEWPWLFSCKRMLQTVTEPTYFDAVFLCTLGLAVATTALWDGDKLAAPVVVAGWHAGITATCFPLVLVNQYQGQTFNVDKAYQLDALVLCAQIIITMLLATHGAGSGRNAPSTEQYGPERDIGLVLIWLCVPLTFGIAYVLPYYNEKHRNKMID